MRKKCPYSEFFWSVFSRIWDEHTGTVNLNIQYEYEAPSQQLHAQSQQ